jgi:4-amino-4-deoxy-L-arabinose transferase-like glycosyltransferase
MNADRPAAVAPRRPGIEASWKPLAALVVLAALLRGAFLLLTRSAPVFRVPDLDAAFYHVWARSLAEGRGDFQGPYFLGPLYPHVLALLYRIFGPAAGGVRLVQTVLGLLDVALVHGLARRLFGFRAGIVAGLVLALYGPLAFFEGLLLVEALLTTLVLASAWVLLVPSWPAPVRGASAGALLALASLGRATVLLVLPVALWSMARRGGAAPSGRPAARALAAALACLLVLAPVLVRNARQGALALTTNGGVNLYAGNSPGAAGRFHAPPGVSFFHTVPAPDPRAPLPPDVAARFLTVRAAAGTEAAADSPHWRRLAVNWARSHPGDFGRLFLRKLWLLLQAREVAHLESFGSQRARIPALWLFPVDFGVLLPLALLGWWRARRERVAGSGVLAAYAGATLLPCIVFFVTARYRLAAVPLLAPLAGFGAATLWSWIRVGDRRRGAIALAFLLSLGGIQRLGGAPAPEQLAWEHVQMADRLTVLGDRTGALRELEDAVRLAPGWPEASLQLARTLGERGGPADLERAASILRGVIRRAPQEPAAWFELGILLVRQGRADEARRAWREALAIDPRFDPARQRLRASGAEP